ncbi:xylosidase/arabinosidase, putative [Talaromyces stipitatus ATCC 10500]|uniref:Xylosidase/arabinosidase, putative n=1 Tax=Talaromyces stipitatus (strain ATCC 10500 / CBS 375.48 / QM 6759 / NRRL 1006) TaxID=441959 RepID=B8MQP4_TALSN|nr:xylosidase/arabinosidase, putative [Talaromyces stipitatus ATCC 10500]EED13467.1 xylosidase/arabinosidase, putative [Talaromyces stipitatus ATCC 10500]
MPAGGINPIIPGFAPDPSAIQVGDTYFLVNSSFHIFPGLPIYASKDLVSWRHIGNAINRQTQLSLAASRTKLNPEDDEAGDMMCATGGLYAPTIRYYDGIFYIVCTNVIHGAQDGSTSDQHQNFIVSATDIWSNQWSDPVFFEFDGIDTSLFWDSDGRAYMHGSAAPGPMTTIKLFEIDIKTGQKLSDEKMIWDGTGGIWPEGPHIYHNHDGWYYLFISEGGTFENHMVTVARSKSIWGPYEANPDNPILTARGTDEYIQHTGHSDLFQNAQGHWWAVCLAVRKDKSKRYVLGRETFLTPVHWTQGSWPAVSRVKSSFPLEPGRSIIPDNAVATLSADPGMDWCYIRDADLTSHKIEENGKEITLTASESDLCQADTSDQVTFIGKRQRRLHGHSQVAVQHVTTGTLLDAGLCIYKDEHRFARIFREFDSPAVIVFELVNEAKFIHRTKRITIDLGGNDAALTWLRLEYSETTYKCSYRLEHNFQWTEFADFDTLEMTGHDFVGPIVGVFAFTKEVDREIDVIFRGFEVE